MRYLFLLAALAAAGCNTFAGIGKDLSETGKAVENSAGWSQDQINKADTRIRTNN